MTALMRMILYMLAALMVTGPACAWDQSVLTDVRFSPDGRYFSFVEYTEPEAEERGFASLYVIDAASDTWAAATPRRVSLEGEGASGKKALAELQNGSLDLIQRFGLRDGDPPIVPFLEIDRGAPYDRRHQVFVPALKSKLVLVQRKAMSAQPCGKDVPSAIDFRLVLSGRETIRLADYARRLPRSRGCAIGYDIAAAFLHKTAERTVLAVLIGVFTRGWEGSNRQLIAVTKVLPPSRF
ncbi:DUF2259 domain-containing protein [Tardiphaga alba]|nr:DUF2259 domain-containing protein [Tardiphaga alba]